MSNLMTLDIFFPFEPLFELKNEYQILGPLFYISGKLFKGTADVKRL
jgi:hypothetical protein